MFTRKQHFFFIIITSLVYALFMFLFDFLAFNEEIEFTEYLIQGTFFGIFFGLLMPLYNAYYFRKQTTKIDDLLPVIIQSGEEILFKTSASLGNNAGKIIVTDNRILYISYGFKNSKDFIPFTRDEITNKKLFKRYGIIDDGLHIQTQYKSFSFRVEDRTGLLSYL